MAQEQGKDEAVVEEDFFQTARPTSLLQRFIEPGEVAKMITVVCSPVSSATNGPLSGPTAGSSTRSYESQRPGCAKITVKMLQRTGGRR
jgi:hypothetical protein